MSVCFLNFFRGSLLGGTAAFFFFTGSISAQTSSNEIQELKQLIEEQRKSIDALKEKVQRLEEQQVQHPSTNTPAKIPAVVIDTNGLPIGHVDPATEKIETKLQALEQRQDLAETNALEKAKKSPRITLGSDGFAVTSANTNFGLRLKGIFQVDSRSFINDNPYLVGNDSILVRRARPIIEGTLFRDFEFEIMPEFAGASPQLYELWINYKYAPGLQFRAGKVNGPVGPESLVLDSMLLFNERSFVSSLLPTRSLGFELWGELFDKRLEYSLGVFNGDGDARLPANSDFGDDKVYAARIFAQPFRTTGPDFLKGFGFGLGGSFGSVHSNSAALPGTTGGSFPGYFTPGQQQFFAYNPVVGPVVADGPHWRLYPHGFFNYGPFGLLGEYAISDQGVYNSFTLQQRRVQNRAWQISAQWVLTGEPAGLDGITPRRPFNPVDGGWGAWQVVGRLSGIDIDPVAFQGFSDPTQSANSARSWSLGLNWWLTRNVRIMTSVSDTHFHGGGTVFPANPLTTAAPAAVTHQDELVLFSRVQLAF